MAKSYKKRQKGFKKELQSPFKNYWEKSNYILLGLGLAVLVLGFFLMTFGPWDNPVSRTISPIVLLVAYVIIFPFVILHKKKKPAENTNDVPS